MYIWQLNIFRAKFEDEEFDEEIKGKKLYWKIEYGDNPAGPRGKEYTPTSKKKPTWNYWTQIRDSKDNNRLELTMLNKTEGNKPIASLQIDLLPYKKDPDSRNDFWKEVQDVESGKIVGKLHLAITYKTFEVSSRVET
mmetsp:Transcript_87602/g.249152  ORF Transcript_87602/g.249152 Transcript_87602/m.249152 type:complete len:138 (-) Transcript_87602:704-1117(-)